jgi:restriction system protein
MAVPEYHKIMLPLLRAARDGKIHSISALIDQLSNEFKLSDGERNELLPSGLQVKFDNRVGWARTYLKKAGLLEAPERGKVKITDRGVAFLKEHSAPINSKDLMQFDEFREFKNRPGQVEQRDSGTEEVTETPQESVERNVSLLTNDLAEELLVKIKELSPKFFERLVVELLVAMGYGGSRKDAGSAIGRSGDGGIDGIIKQDSLGLDVVYIQAKRWEGTVGRPDVAEFVGSLAGVRAQRGIMLTTSSFSKEAEKYVEKIGERIILINGRTLAELMIEHGVGVSTVQTFAVKKIDNDFFIED